MKPTTPRRGRPPSTSQEEIVQTAMRLLDQHGVHGLTMKQLAAEIGVTTMALYRHVDDKETLLALALNATAESFADMTFPADPRERVVAAMMAVYETLIKHPWVPEALTGPQRTGRGGLTVTDTASGALFEITGDRVRAHRHYRACWSLTLGTVLNDLRQHAEASDPESAAWMARMLASLPEGSVPHLRAAVEAHIPPSGAADFEISLRALLDGLIGPAQKL